MKKLLKYKNYFGSVEFSLEDEILYGKIECVNDVITYEADTLPALIEAFHDAVDDYLDTCAEFGKAPDRSMSGTFNIRIGEDLHKRAYLQSKSDGINLNDFIRAAVREKLDFRKEYHFHFDRRAEDKSLELTFSSKLNTRTEWSKNEWSRRHETH